ncbi:MAG: DUF2304 domain-containing protein [Bacillota bacterium]|uniref:DUF2304 domain-containing protein n=1 Tax=unclassified Virgibacillus TaxID=2620237 RepID=UPI000EF4B899|nr:MULTISPECIES: DUF2304 domain-containing protein [unclassified Virgibacillus]MCC2250624.1 DUF2304 domain-containing protein [Virgibacillus sp. AGTR]MDY7045834.1 DUF2304 domain-containing protein [Virgibacillus sp. M23]QRZ18460.1 DUF2304 domain-containing protein [Virgibacillus sp. AGTR]
MNITLFSFLIICFFFTIVIESVRRGILETRDSLIWIFVCVILGILSLSRKLLEIIADLLGIAYAPSLLFLFGLLSTIIMIFDLTRRISKLNRKVIHLTQEFALLKEQQQDNTSSENMIKREKKV